MLSVDSNADLEFATSWESRRVVEVVVGPGAAAEVLDGGEVASGAEISRSTGRIGSAATGGASQGEESDLASRTCESEDGEIGAFIDDDVVYGDDAIVIKARARSRC